MLGAALLVTLAMVWRGFGNAPQPSAVLSLDVPSTQQLDMTSGPAVVISPDGSRVAYVARTGGLDQIFVRELDQPQAKMLEGAQGTALFFSPDGQWIGYFNSNSVLEKVSVFGGAPVAICNATGARGAWWGKDGTIIFTPGFTSPLQRVSAAGGQPQPLTHLDASRKEVTHRWPQILPGGKDVLFTDSGDNNDFSHSAIAAVTLATGQVKRLVESAYFGRYLASGYLVYVSGGTLFAVPFNPRAMKLTGAAMPIIQNVAADLSNGSAQFSASATGTAVYVTGKTQVAQSTVAVVDRQGNATPLISKPGEYYAPRFSPDGKQLALQVGTGNTWVYDLARQTLTPLTFPPADCLLPVWTPDGKRIACDQSNPPFGGGMSLSWIPANGTGSLQPLTEPGSVELNPSSWSPDGKALAFYRPHSDGGCCEIWTLSVNSSGKPGKLQPVVGHDPPLPVSYPAFSPDGHWLAYSSVESGAPQVYVIPYPGPGGKRQISTTGAYSPRWSKTGHELFFEQAANPTSVFAVSYSVEGNSFQAGIPKLLFKGNFVNLVPYPGYDVSPDGKHFAMMVPVGGATGGIALPTVALNWFEHVQQMVSSGRK